MDSVRYIATLLQINKQVTSCLLQDDNVHSAVQIISQSKALIVGSYKEQMESQEPDSALSKFLLMFRQTLEKVVHRIGQKVQLETLE